MQHILRNPLSLLFRRFARTATTDNIRFEDYGVESRPRFGTDAHRLARIGRLLADREPVFAKWLERCLTYREPLLAIRREEHADGTEPHWDNGFFGGLDLVALYTFLRERRPERYLEIGSGNSTRVARRAIRDGGLPTRITSIDPEPRASIDGICDVVVRSALENADLSVVDDLRAGDVLFYDGSHRSLMNSDVTVFFLEVLPRVRPGVLVQIHDIFLPHDYPAEWAARMYNEQYLLASVLTFGNALEPLFPANYIANHPSLSRVLDPLWRDPRFPVAYTGGVSFWTAKR